MIYITCFCPTDEVLPLKIAPLTRFQTPRHTLYLASFEPRPGGSLRQLMEIFDKMKSEAGWDVNSKLLWGYFFTNKTPEKLHKAAKDLKADGYRFVKVYQDDAKESYWLQVEKEESHTPHTLYKRNQELAEFAAKHGLMTYDGMDVGPIEQTK